MENQKLDNILNLSLSVTPEEREENPLLSFAQIGERYEVVAGVTEDFYEYLEGFPEIPQVTLLGGYVILYVTREELDVLSELPQIRFIEQAKPMWFSINLATSEACITPLREAPYELRGSGVLVGFVDSGLDFFHQDFRNEDGTTRVVWFWDQEEEYAEADNEYGFGRVYSREELNELLETGQRVSRDLSGHGTAVAGVAAGNGTESGGRYQGAAPEADLLVVRLASSRGSEFLRTTQLMCGVDFCVRRAVDMGMPIALNLSIGTTYGAHNGTSLLETYLDTISNFGKITICVGSGNEGVGFGHYGGRLANGQERIVEISVGQRQPSFTLQLWKNYYDQADVFLEAPTGRTTGFLKNQLGPYSFRLDNTEILLYYGEPGPYAAIQEIFFSFGAATQGGTAVESAYVNSGIWRVHIVPRRILTGEFDLWLDSLSSRSRDTKFLTPIPENTLTIPGTAGDIITVGAYNGLTDGIAEFSGRGSNQRRRPILPDIVAPGVNLQAPVPGGGYNLFSGTSFASPLVAGACALLMEWGIVRGNDPFLYGEKVKEYFKNGARKLPGQTNWPNIQDGWGAICVRNSIP